MKDNDFKKKLSVETPTEKELKKFKKDFDKLMAKYPGVMVSNDTHSNLNAYLTDGRPFGKTHSVRLG